MDFILGNERKNKIIVATLIVLIIVLFVGLFKLITGSLIVGILLFLALLYYMLRLLGTFVMYPGSSFLTRSDLQMRMSKQISQRMCAFFNCVHFLHMCVAKKQYSSHQNPFDLIVVIINHILTMKDVLSMFQTSLSERKIKMLDCYRQIESLVEEKEEDLPSIEDIIKQPRAIEALPEQTAANLVSKFQRIQLLMRELHAIIKSYSPPEGLLALLKFRMTQENLYEIRFAFHTWKTAFNYQLFIVKTTDNDQIETTIIHNELKKTFFSREPSSKPNTSKKAILFCNPNGVFVQFFGFDNEYIRNYLRLGYNVIMWNYRGYGQSTGTPTIVRSQIDAAHVYQFYREQGYEISIIHGYSIGGAAAVGIFERIPPVEAEKIEILIIDRSFSSIGQMSIEFGPALHSLTKLLFFGDNIDLSKQFESVRCKKLLIWDNLDQVIPDRASFKCRIIKRKRGQSSNSSMYGIDEDLQINQLNEDDNNNPDFENLTQKLAFTIRKIAEQQTVNSEEGELNGTSKVNEMSQSDYTVQSSNMSLNNYQQLIKIVKQLDGGGLELLNDIGELKELFNRRPDKFHHICESYILGIVCYGSYFPLKPFLYDHQKIKEQTLLKIDRSMQTLKQSFGIDIEKQDPNFMFKKQSSLAQLAKNMYHIYFRLSQLVTDYFSEEWFNLHGSLLPTNNGHNSSLTNTELSILNEFIRNCSQQPLCQKEDQSEKML